jgi:hypothetical protein
VRSSPGIAPSHNRCWVRTDAPPKEVGRKTRAPPILPASWVPYLAPHLPLAETPVARGGLGRATDRPRVSAGARASLSWSAVGAIPLGASPLHSLPSVLMRPAQDHQMQRSKQPRQSPPKLRGGNREVQVLRVPNREARDADQVPTIIEQAAARGTLRHWRGDLDVLSIF